MSQEHEHHLAITQVDHLGPHLDPSVGEAPVNLFQSANYVVVEVGLPGCRGEHIRIAMADGGLLVEAERHPGEDPTVAGRYYLLHELAIGGLGRFVALPDVDLALHEASAHFADGMLTVSIPTRERDAYRHHRRDEAARPDL